jgi:hypothetical protein
MKKLVIVFAVLMLNGCALFDAYFMAGYDNQEYVLINKIRTKAQLSQRECVDRDKTISNILVLIDLSAEFKNFTQHIPRNPEAYKMATQMTVLVDQSAKAYNDSPSQFFCKAKLQQIERNAETIQTVLGSKPR